MPDDAQGFLFGPPDTVQPAPPAPNTHALARLLPPSHHHGTSTWTFPGWSGLVYRAPALPAQRTLTERALAEPSGLAAYAAFPLFRTVGLDRAFYRPLPEPEYRALAAAVPEGFRFLVKAWQAITRPEADDSGHTHGPTAAHSTPNSVFLDPVAALDLVLTPAATGLGPALGPVLFQLPPLDLSRSGRLGGVRGVVDRLAGFVRALPPVRARPCPDAGPPSPVLCAIELRNRQFFEPAHTPELAELAAACREHAWVLAPAGHPSVPPIADQVAAIERAGWNCSDWPALVVRWLLRADQTYEGAKRRYAPFGDIVDPDGASLGQIARLCAHAAGHGRSGWVIVNNKAEGSAPISVARLARAITHREGLGDAGAQAGPDS
jgi:uncharacterized protein YecE (DUF72 family)